MLVLGGTIGARIHIGDQVVVRVLDVAGGRVSLGIDAPGRLPVHREVVYRMVRGEDEEETVTGTTGRGKQHVAHGAVCAREPQVTSILVADDEPLCRHLVVAALAGPGRQIVIARDGLEAWDALQGPRAPELAILDWMMPGIDGIEVCERIRSAQRLRYVILLTARARREDLRTGLAAGADDYLVKPFDVAELRSHVRLGERVLRLERALAARGPLPFEATGEHLN